MQSSKQKDKAKAGQPTPVLDRARANDMNLAVLKRIDSEVEEVLANAGHVCLYRMSVEDQQWQRKNIEGTLFLTKRRSQPRFQMIVLNKLSTDNYCETVHGGLELEVNPPYLMYTHGNDEIHGIWFYDVEDIQRIASLLTKILAQLPKPDAAAQLELAPAPAPAAAPVPVQAAAQQPQVQQPQAPHPQVQQPRYQQVMQPQQQALQQEQYVQPQAPASSHGSYAPAAAAAPRLAAPQPKKGANDDAFWDKSVHVTEETLPPVSEQFGRHNVLLADTAASPVAAPGSGAPGGQPPHNALLHKLTSAQQRYAGVTQPQQQVPERQQVQSPLPPAGQPQSTPAPGRPAPNASSTPTGPTALLTPSFFQQQAGQQPLAHTPPSQQQQQQQQQQPSPLVQPQQHQPQPQHHHMQPHVLAPHPAANGSAAADGPAGGTDTSSHHHHLRALFSKAAKLTAQQPPVHVPHEPAPAPSNEPHPSAPGRPQDGSPGAQQLRSGGSTPLAFLGRGPGPHAGAPFGGGPSPFGTPGQLPVPPAPPPQPQALGGQKEKLRQAVARLMQNDAFVELLIGELRTVGLMPQ